MSDLTQPPHHPQTLLKLHTPRVPDHHIQTLPPTKPHDMLHIQTCPMQVRREGPPEGMRFGGIYPNTDKISQINRTTE
jgi:hypothetical protein